jgi:hypothetical protein
MHASNIYREIDPNQGDYRNRSTLQSLAGSRHLRFVLELSLPTKAHRHFIANLCLRIPYSGTTFYKETDMYIKALVNSSLALDH